MTHEMNTTSPPNKVRVVGPDQQYSIGDVLTELRQFRVAIETRIDNLKGELLHDIDNKIGKMKQEFNQRYQYMEGKFQYLEQKIQSMDNTIAQSQVARNDKDMCTDPLKDYERCIVVRGLPEQQGEDLKDKIETMLSALGGEVYNSVTVVCCERLRARGKGPGLVKIAFSNPDKK